MAALAALDLEVAAGQVYGYLGPNGAGKTTTIRILLGLLAPTTGTAELLGGRPTYPGARARVGYLPGELRLDDRLTAAELLEHWGRVRGGVDRRERARLCERLALDPTRPTRLLSSGNRRKVGLVGAFQSRPDLLILDEPTGGLDPLVQAEFLRLLDEARGEGRTVFLSSHVLGEVQRVADRVAVIREGRLISEGRVDALRHTARQRIEVWFDDPVPQAELERLPGLGDLAVDGPHLSCTMAGPLGPLLALLGTHAVRSLVVPEPDLEDAFLSLYHGADGRAGADPGPPA